MSFSAGARVGAYQILDKLGQGGMGEVYRARDTKLNRDVALKVLSGLFARDAERLARFTREAQVLASLNHPNIGAIYGIEGDALVMEFVDGQDLSALIGRGPMPLADVLPVAKQIADALEAAHEQGIVHRDLKPANIKVKADGTVKVLDFGLAKAVGPEGGSAPDLMNSPTLTAHATPMGMVMGTAAYMAPEQARGKPVDRRADIWAFGVVLYEMLTGRRAFDGDDVSITLASVLKDDPKWQELPADLPTPLSRLLRRCLEKEPKRRLSAIGDARLELEEHEATSVAMPPPPAAGARARISMVSRLWPAVAGIVITAAAAAFLWPSAPSSTSAGVARMSILPPPGETVYPDSLGVAVSPDGTMVAFVVGSVARSENELWVRSLESMSAQRLEGTQGAALPFWSPDGRRIGFFTNSKLKVVTLSGGRVETLADAPSGRGAAWNRSNVIVFAPWSPDGTRVVWAADRDGAQDLFVKSVDEAAPEQVLFRSDVPFKNPVDWSSDGQWIVMTHLDQDTSQNVWLLDASGSKPPTVIVRGAVRDNGGPVSPDGRWIAYTSEDTGRFEVYIQSFPAPGRKVQASSDGAVRAWWTRDGRQLVMLGGDFRTLSRVDLTPGASPGVGTPKPFARLPADIVWVDVMPDRQRFLAISPERTGTGSVTVVQNWRAALVQKR